MDSRSVAIPPLSGRTALPTVQRRYALAIPLLKDGLPIGLITKTDPSDHDADLGDHDRPIQVIMMLRSE
jgi:hypothetical protein